MNQKWIQSQSIRNYLKIERITLFLCTLMASPSTQKHFIWIPSRVNILELYMNHIIVHKLSWYIREEAEVRICD